MGLKIARHGRFPGTKNRPIAPRNRPPWQPRNAMAAAEYFRRKRQRAFVSALQGNLTIGDGLLTHGFAQGSYGAINPSDVGGVEIAELSSDLGDLMVLAFVGNQQLPDIAAVPVTFSTFSATAINMVWSPTNTRYEGQGPAGLNAWMQANVGNMVPFSFTSIEASGSVLDDATVLDDPTVLE